MSVGKRVFSKTTHRFFLKLLMKLGSLKGKKLAELDFGGGESHFGNNAQKYPENRVIWILQKNSSLICRFFEFKSCTIMTLKRMSVKNLVLKLNAKMLSANQIARFLNFNISKTIGGTNVIFCMKVHIY